MGTSSTGKTIDSTTLVFIERILAALPRRLTEEKMKDLHTSGQLREFLSALDDPARLEDALMVLRREVAVDRNPRQWCEQDGVIYFTVTSTGTTGRNWIEFFGEDNVTPGAQKVLLAEKFKPTTRATTRVALVQGEIHPASGNSDIRPPQQVNLWGRDVAKEGVQAEVACLIAQKFSSADFIEMGIDNISVPVMAFQRDRALIARPGNISSYRNPQGYKSRLDEHRYAYVVETKNSRR